MLTIYPYPEFLFTAMIPLAAVRAKIDPHQMPVPLSTMPPSNTMKNYKHTTFEKLKF